jgi:hypothetical protein
MGKKGEVEMKQEKDGVKECNEKKVIKKWNEKKREEYDEK